MKDILYDGSYDHDGNGEDGNDNDDNGAVHVQAKGLCRVKLSQGKWKFLL